MYVTNATPISISSLKRNLDINSIEFVFKIAPNGFGNLLRKIATDYKNLTIYIMEMGVSDKGETHDLFRVNIYHDYVKELLIAVNRDHVNVKGFFLWSLLDNFEWDRGYR